MTIEDEAAAPATVATRVAPADAADAESGPDETRDGSVRRRCAFSACRAPLPVASGPGNKPRYCQNGKSWGPKQVSCKQAGHAEETLASIYPNADAPPLAITELSEQVDAALGPTQQLLTALQQVRTQLESDVTTARQERDEALRTAAEADSSRADALDKARDAEQRRAEAEATTAAAEQRRAEADAERDRAVRIRTDAERAQLRAETQRDSARQETERAETRVLAATERAEQAEQRLASTTAELSSAQEQLDDLRRRVDDERSRAERAITDSEATVAKLRDEFEARLERARQQAAAETKQLREEQELARQQAQALHANDLSELHRRLGGAQQQLSEATAHAEAANSRLQRYRSGITEVLQQRSSGQPPDNGVFDQLSAMLDDSDG